MFWWHEGCTTFAFLDDEQKSLPPDLLQIERTIAYDVPYMVGQKGSVQEDYERLEQVRQQFPLTASETFAKLYHILPGIPFYPVTCAQHATNLETNSCEEMNEEELKQLSWTKLSLVMDHMGLACVKSCVGDVSRRRRSYRASLFARWDIANKTEPDIELDYKYEEEIRQALGSSFDLKELRQLGMKLVMALVTNESLDNINELDWILGKTDESLTEEVQAKEEAMTEAFNHIGDPVKDFEFADLDEILRKAMLKDFKVKQWHTGKLQSVHRAWKSLSAEQHLAIVSAK